MLSRTTAETLPAPSLYCTNTVLVLDPPPLSVQLLLVAKGFQAAVARALELLAMRIEGTPESGAGSLAWRVRVTVRFLVEALPPFISTEPLGPAVSTLNVRLAGVWSKLPLASVALTSKEYLPWVNPLDVCVPLPEQSPNVGGVSAAGYTRHSKVDPVSLAEKLKVRLVWFVALPSAMPLSIRVFGAVASMENVRLLVVSKPTLSRARTVKV
jgi:hypothetical protein